MRPTSTFDEDGDGESGFALVAVLWFLVLVSAVVASFAVAARTDLLIASNARQKLRLDIAAESMATAVLLRLGVATNSTGSTEFSLDSTPQTCTSDRYTVELRVQDQSGLVDLNVADEKLLAIGLQTLGLAKDEGVTVAKAIIASRSYQSRAQSQTEATIVGGEKGGPFESVVELSDIGPLADREPAELHRVFTVHSRQPFVSLARSPQALAQSLEGHDTVVQRKANAGDPRALAIEVIVADRSTAIRGYAGYLTEQSQTAGRPFRRTEPLIESVFITPHPGPSGECPLALRDALTQLVGNYG